MTIETYQIISSSLEISLLLISIIFAFGVVWRVEKELDISYKFILSAIIILTGKEIVELFDSGNSIIAYYFITFSKILFAILFLAGILTMRNILRKMDGEK